MAFCSILFANCKGKIQELCERLHESIPSIVSTNVPLSDCDNLQIGSSINIRGARLLEGQPLQRRALDANGAYTAKAGDFCYDIAVRYGVLLDTLRELQRQNPGAL
jgi:hypothetical protein